MDEKNEIAQGHMVTQDLGSEASARALLTDTLRPVKLEEQLTQRRGPHLVRFCFSTYFLFDLEKLSSLSEILILVERGFSEVTR